MRYLSYCFKEGLAFDIAYRAAYLRHNYVGVTLLAYAVDEFLYFVGNMRNYLYGLAEIISATLFVEHVPVYLTGSKVGILIELDIYESFVVSEVEVGFRAILRNVHFTVFVRTHCTGVHVDIRVKLLSHNLKSSCLEQSAKARHCNTFTQARYYTACNKYVLCHTSTSPSNTFLASPVI